MRAFHGQQSVKDKYLARVRHHRKMDNLIQGTGWENGKGCAIGCTLEEYNHSLYPVELGLPEWLARLEDRIFEGLPRALAMQWPERLLSAIKTGADVELVRHRLAVRRLSRLIALQEKTLKVQPDEHGLHEAVLQVIRAIEVVRSCHEAEAGGSACEASSWSAARSASWSAARSASWSAAWSAAAAAAAARSASWSAARSAAESAAWIQESDDLIELLQEAP